MIIPKNHQLTCLRCGWIYPHPTIDPYFDVLCPNCNTDLTMIFNNPEDFCQECASKSRVGKVEMFSVTDDRIGTMAWIIPYAYAIADLTNIVELNAEKTAKYLRVNVTEPRHYAHISTDAPGLIAEFRVGKQSVYCLIDGSHRAAKCLQLKQPFSVYWLSYEQSEQCRIDARYLQELGR